MAENTIGGLDGIAEAKVGGLPTAPQLDDDALLAVEIQGSAYHATGAQFKALARVGVSEYVEAAMTAAQNALAAARQAQEAVASVQGAAEQAAAAEAANEAAQAAMQAAEEARKAAEAAAQSAADDAAQDVAANMSAYVTAAQAAQAAAEAARDQAQAIAGGDFLSLAGGTLTGPLVLAGDPTTDSQAATKKYVDDNKGIYIATYGTTTNAEIYEAAQAGKRCFCCQGIFYGALVSANETLAYFSLLLPTGMARVLTCQNDEWEAKNITFEQIANKVTALSADSTDGQYPSAKAVYDAIQTAISGTWEASY